MSTALPKESTDALHCSPSLRCSQWGTPTRCVAIGARSRERHNTVRCSASEFAAASLLEDTRRRHDELQSHSADVERQLALVRTHAIDTMEELQALRAAHDALRLEADQSLRAAAELRADRERLVECQAAISAGGDKLLDAYERLVFEHRELAASQANAGKQSSELDARHHALLEEREDLLIRVEAAERVPSALGPPPSAPPAAAAASYAVGVRLRRTDTADDSLVYARVRNAMG